jgi:hypothetical protein
MGYRFRATGGKRLFEVPERLGCRGLRAGDRDNPYPTCVRHLSPRKDVRLRHYFLCDACATAWTSEAFDGNKPVCTSGRK